MSLELLQVLYLKVEEFQNKLSSPVQEQLQCKKGCSKCCYVDLSVFEVEARAILTWFEKLDPNEQKQWLQKIETPLNEGACAFLRSEECTIYAARPLICRTQGLALQFKNQSDEMSYDICPLNDEASHHLQAQDILNLDLINSVLSTIESQDSKAESRERILLKDLFNQMQTRARS